MATLALDRIGKSFGTTRVLDDVCLDIADGEFLTLVGPSGCGKTTLLRIIAGLDAADSGSIAIDGVRVDTLAPKRRDVAMVFQSYALYPYMTVAQNMALPLTMRRLSRAQRLPLVGRLVAGTAAARAAIDREVATVAASLGIEALLARKPAQLSGGQRQRVALGRAMVRHPKVFLMDEPLSNLDAKLRVQTRAEIAELHRRLGTTFVYVTHDQTEAMTMSDRVALMMNGRLLQLATPQRIYDDPVDLRVAEFIGTPKLNALPAMRTLAGLAVQGRRWPLATSEAAGTRLTLAVRPEWWTLATTPVALDEASCTVLGRVRHLEALGAETLVHVAADDIPETLVAKLAPERASALRIDEPVALTAPAERVLVFDAEGQRVTDVHRQTLRRAELAVV
jgi:multiple sugar transport system ATP-binding protein